MKKGFLICIMCLMALTAYAQKCAVLDSRAENPGFQSPQTGESKVDMLIWGYP